MQEFALKESNKTRARMIIFVKKSLFGVAFFFFGIVFVLYCSEH